MVGIKIKTIIKCLVSLFIFAILSPVYAASLGGAYNHDLAISYMMLSDKLDFSLSKKKIIVKVDFKNNTIKRLAEGNFLGGAVVNYNGTLMAYNDYKNLYIYSVLEASVIKKIPGYIQPYPVWANTKNILGFYDTVNHKLVEYYIDDRISKSASFRGMLYGSSWSDICKCYYFEVSEKYDTPRKIVKIDGDIIRDVSDEKSVIFSPDKKYYIKYVEEETMAYFNIHRYSDNKILYNFLTKSTIRGSEVIWGSDTLRILDHKALIDLRDGRLLNHASSIWTKKQSRPKPNINRPIDVAASRRNFVLTWNRGKKIFEVEDINNGKIVKRYEKFW